MIVATGAIFLLEPTGKDVSRFIRNIDLKQPCIYFVFDPPLCASVDKNFCTFCMKSLPRVSQRLTPTIQGTLACGLLDKPRPSLRISR